MNKYIVGLSVVIIVAILGSIILYFNMGISNQGGVSTETSAYTRLYIHGTRAYIVEKTLYLDMLLSSNKPVEISYIVVYLTPHYSIRINSSIYYSYERCFAKYKSGTYVEYGTCIKGTTTISTVYLDKKCPKWSVTTVSYVDLPVSAIEINSVIYRECETFTYTRTAYVNITSFINGTVSVNIQLPIYREKPNININNPIKIEIYYKDETGIHRVSTLAYIRK